MKTTLTKLARGIRRLLIGRTVENLQSDIAGAREEVQLLWHAIDRLTQGDELPPAVHARLSIAKLRDSFSREPLVSVNCPVCEGAHFEPLIRRDRHDLGIETQMCTFCGFVTLRPRPGEEWFTRFYKDYFWPIYIGSEYRDTTDLYVRDKCEQRAEEIVATVLGSLSVTPRRCLDIGAGLGGTMTVLSRHLPLAHIEGLEPSNEGVAYCQSRGLGVTSGDIQSLASIDTAAKFDLITIIHVLEHLVDPVSALRTAAERLSESGALYVEVPDLESTAWSGKSFFHVAHLHYFYEQSLFNVLDLAGLVPFQTFHGASSHWPWAIGVLAKLKDASGNEASVPRMHKGQRRLFAMRVRRRVDG